MIIYVEDQPEKLRKYEWIATVFLTATRIPQAPRTVADQ